MPIMTLFTKYILIALACYAFGTIVGPVAFGAVQSGREVFTPFLFTSMGILIASIGYAVGSIRRSIPARRDQREDYR